jgi:hypothetical protein
MIREQVTVQDFERISRENKYFIWHFLMRDNNFSQPSMRSIFDENEKFYRSPNAMVKFLEIFDVPYFESFTDESIDFLDMLGVPINNLRLPKRPTLKSFILTFNHKRLVNASYNGFCFCPEGITDLLHDLNPDFIYNAKLD